LRLTQRRFEGGVTGSSDVRLARSSVANAQALQASREQRLSAITRQLEVLLRRYPAEELQAAPDLPTLPRLSGAGTPGYVLRKRPDILALRHCLCAGQQVWAQQVLQKYLILMHLSCASLQIRLCRFSKAGELRQILFSKKPS